MKHEHNEFPSDIYLMLETAGATLSIGEFNCDWRQLSVHLNFHYFTLGLPDIVQNPE
jgi:hypothetical protein